jgi:hypothetical protein
MRCATSLIMAFLAQQPIIPRHSLVSQGPGRPGCLNVFGKPLSYGRGPVIVALISQCLLSRARQYAVSVSQNPGNG